MQQSGASARSAEVIHGVTPATELAAAVRALAAHSTSAEARWWPELVVSRLGGGALELLSALAAPAGELPLVLDPSAAVGRSLEPGLAAIADTPAPRIRESVERAHGGMLPPSRALRAALGRGDAGAVVARALWECWRLTLRPEWPSLEEALHAEARVTEAAIRRDGALAALERVGLAHGSASLAASSPLLVLAPSFLEPAVARLSHAEDGGWRLTYRAAQPGIFAALRGRVVPHPAR
ncbi:hypothetical protein [Intrasporangium sp.]|uniref:hypothetical protein n=1 Tax=Intrasporangium sp. TaxID=1925024 RepID=UPI00293B0978|nr:hypothetical protein [Intrasporangium sp.]MDV3220672.1 hypothetical protein [Intrasporangium sp.]